MGLRLVTFGDPRLIDEQGKALAFPEKGIIALAYLLLQKQHRASRLELAELLWGDNDSVNALANLRKLLSRIKSRQAEVDIPVLQIGDTHVQAILTDLSCDLDDLKPAKGAGPLSALAAYHAVITGEFLAGHELTSETGGFWLASEREKLLSRFAAEIEKATTSGAFRENSELLREAAYRLLALDSYSEIAFKALIASFAADGYISRARQIYKQYEERLWSDLKTVPDKALLAFAEALFAAGAAAAAPVPGSSAEPAPASARADIERPTLRLPRLLILPPGEHDASIGRHSLLHRLLEDVTLSLCQARSVAIVAPHTAQKMASLGGDLSADLERHHVSYVVKASLRGVDDPNLFATLSDCATDNVIWADTFDVRVEAMATTFSALVHRIAKSIVDRLERNELSKIARTRQPDAYQHYLVGKEHLRRVDLPNVRRARKAFRAAVQLAPDFAGALSGLARADHLEWLVTARGDTDLLASVETNAMKAILADTDHPGGYHMLGVAKLYQSAFDESLDAYQGAELSAPTHADLIADYADALVHSSKPEQGLAKIERAIEINPLCPDLYWWTAAGANYCLERFDAALDNIGKLEDRSATTRIEAACWAMLGEKQKANALVEKTMEIYPDFEVDRWLSIMPVKENWQREQYREGLRKAGFR